MKRVSVIFMTALFSTAAIADTANLSMVYDPVSKKYFIGGKSKFVLKQGEGGAPAERIEVSVNGAEYKPYDNAIEFDKEGKYTLKFRAANAVNNWSPEQFVEVFVDLTSPSTELKLPEDKFAKNDKGSFLAVNSSLSLSPQDNLSGVGQTEYSWDGSNFIPYNSAVTITREGKQTFYYRSTDRVGNMEPAKSFEFVADARPPHSEVKPSEGAHTVLIDGTTYVNDSVSFTVKATDDLSSVKQIWVSVDGGAAQLFQKPIYFLQEGRHTLSYWTVDSVGNKEAEKTFPVYSVSKLPVAKLDIDGKVVNTGGVNYASPGLTLKLAGDNASIGLDKIEVKMGDKDFEPYFSPIRLSDAGEYRISYRAIDRLGNVEPTKTYRVTVVEKAPETVLSTAQPLVQKEDTAYSPVPNVVTLNVNGSSVGIKQTLVSINDGPFQPYTGPITLSGDQKVVRVAYKSVDLLGNEEAVKYATFNMMSAQPVVNLFVTNGQSSEEEVRTNFLDTPGQRKPSSNDSNR